MNERGSFKRDFNYRGWALALAVAAGIAEVAIRLLPLVAKVI